MWRALVSTIVFKSSLWRAMSEYAPAGHNAGRTHQVVCQKDNFGEVHAAVWPLTSCGGTNQCALPAFCCIQQLWRSLQ
eukprot:243309-Karenia_brevis.AAC.1